MTPSFAPMFAPQWLKTVIYREFCLHLALNVYSTNFLHWLHHVCEYLYPSFKPIWIKYAIIPLLYRKLPSNLKMTASVLFTTCELRVLLLIFISYLRVYWHLWYKSSYLSSRLIILWPLNKYSGFLPPACSDCIFDSILSYLSSIQSRKNDLLPCNFSLVFYAWLIC